MVLTAVGVLLLIGDDTPPRELFKGVLTGGALVLGIGLVLAPLWLRTNRALSDTRAAEAREAERADIAAHLHDSVLQTLTLIRKRADDPETVARLARSQERELRAWLYTDRPEAATSTADVLRDLVAEIEDRHGVEVELVIVGDRPPDAATEVVVAAAREALSNAVRHGAAPVSAYAEISVDHLDVFVRDHGTGFDLATVAPDRHGVKESIIGRMERHGGHATVRCRENGTEVHLSLAAPAVPSTPASTASAASAGPPSPY
ncbi:sensor histidine kinase [Actinomyces ruminis]|uniref:sensor histidine kinase n=1 Tax=Actinomyces ruminis TaxID=1937003 RepID=UPI000B690637